MPLEPKYEEISLTLKKGSTKEGVKVECKTEISADGVNKMLNLSARVAILSTSPVNNGLECNGVVNYFVCYLDNEDKVKKYECSAEFTTTLPSSSKEISKLNVYGRVDKTEADLSGVKLSVGAYVIIEAQTSESQTVNALTGGQSIIADLSEVTMLKSYGQRETVFSLSERFDIDCVVSEVLSQRAEARITAVQCGVGCIIVDGEVHLSAILLQSSDKNDIIRKNKTLPFRAEIDCEDAMPSMTANATVREKSFKTDIAVDEQNGGSTVDAEIVLILSGEAYYSQTYDLATDAFSTSEEVELECEQKEYIEPCEQRSFEQEIIGRAGIDELPVGVSLLACVNENVEIVSTECSDGVNLTGLLTATAFFKDLDGRVFTRKAETPFTCKLQTGFDCSYAYLVRAVAESGKIRMVSATELELSAKVYFTVYPHRNCCIKVVKGVKSLGQKKTDDYALSVYIPTVGESLWSLAKRLNVSPEQVVAINPDLQFPLSGEERIVIYRQLR